MKYFQLDGAINEEMVTKYMEFYNNNISEKYTIVLNSGGGKSVLATLLLHMINDNADNITLVSAGCYSAAFYIFYHAKCKRKIVYGSMGMHHKEYLRDVHISETGNPKYEVDKCEIKNIKSCANNFLSKLMTKEEKKLYNNNDDVYFTFNRMKELFPTLDIIK